MCATAKWTHGVKPGPDPVEVVSGGMSGSLRSVWLRSQVLSSQIAISHQVVGEWPKTRWSKWGGALATSRRKWRSLWARKAVSWVGAQGAKAGLSRALPMWSVRRWWKVIATQRT